MTDLREIRSVRKRPPERFHAFISYTTRERETGEIKKVLDPFLNGYLGPAIKRTLGELPVFYDGWSLQNPSGAVRPSYLLQQALQFAIKESEMLLAFVSPLYVESYWCLLEIDTMLHKAPRAWYDICHKAPSDEMKDQRAMHLRPNCWECLMAALARRMYRRSPAPRHVESPIMQLIWKGEGDFAANLPLSANGLTFDWRCCGRYAEWGARIGEHQWRHGSVSPNWEAQAAAEWLGCEAAMSSTAAAIVDVLRARREAYRQSA
jgi:hypothetical protein